MVKTYNTVKQFLLDNRKYIISTGYAGDPIQVCGKFKVNDRRDKVTFILYHFAVSDKELHIDRSYSISNKTIKNDGRFRKVELEPATTLKHKCIRLMFNPKLKTIRA